MNCGRYLSQSTVKVRLSKSFRIRGTARVDAIFDVFNLFNALNPGIGTTSNRRVTNPTTGLQDAALRKPPSVSGDAQRPDQRVGQIGFRFYF